MIPTLRGRVIRGGISPRRCDRVIQAALVTLGAGLDAQEAHIVELVLPRKLGRSLRATPFDADATVDSLYAAMTRLESRPSNEAREDLQVVCRAIAEMLPAGSRRALCAHLPHDIAALFALRASSVPPPHPARHPVGHHVLATGEPASAHPVSESAPPGAEAHSVDEANPHGATKLSSARGLTQDAVHESVGTTGPRDERTISRARI